MLNKYPDHIVLDIHYAVAQLFHITSLQDYSLLEDDVLAIIDSMLYNDSNVAIQFCEQFLIKLGLSDVENLRTNLTEVDILIKDAAKSCCYNIDLYFLDAITDDFALLTWKTEQWTPSLPTHRLLRI